MQKFHLTIASVSGTLFEGETTSLTIPTTEGEMTVLSRHEPFVGVIARGEVRAATSLGQQRFPVTSGLVEIAHNRATVLV